MAYTAEQMVAHAELHYDSANRLLNRAEQYADDDLRKTLATRYAAAESNAGLLAMKLAEYALRPMGD